MRWFNNYNKKDSYVLKTAEVMDGSVINFAALIVQKSNPQLDSILRDFDETVAMLQK